MAGWTHSGDFLIISDMEMLDLIELKLPSNSKLFEQEDLYFILLGSMEPEAFGSSCQNLGEIYNLGDLLAIK